MQRLTLVAFVCLSVCWNAWASEDDLARAKADFADADRQLNDEYQLTRKALRDSDFEALRDQQRDWLKYRDERSLEAVRYDQRSIPEGQEKSTAHYWQMMADLTRNRTEMVRGWRDIRADKPLTGRYSDDYGGTILLVEKDDRLYFAIDVVRGPTYHLGRISGSAQINGYLARYTDNARDKDEETWVTFITGGRRLKVMTVNAQYYHGARAYFDGDYLRVDDLTDEQKQAVLDGKAFAEN